MEIWDSLNRRYLDFIKKQGARREESWLFRGLREPGGGRAEELARRAHGHGNSFLPKKGKAGKKCEAAAGRAGERRPRDGVQHGRLAASGAGAAGAAAGARSRESRRARRRRVRRTAQLRPAARRGPTACRLCAPGRRPAAERARRWPPPPCPPRNPRRPRTLGLRRGLSFRSH
ncbi:histone H1, gonadal-like [Loxodonta africana]|uniref:histone H1, gonadal-like n=1 Tax=Loxodonta africana TaxID=9785 RepID=UPI0030D18932